jgi:signal transduction histidine kinase
VKGGSIVEIYVEGAAAGGSADRTSLRGSATPAGRAAGDVDRRRVPPARRPMRPAVLAATAAGLSAAYALGALLPFWYLSAPAGGAAFFPSAGLTLAVLVLTPRRTWPLWLTVVAITEAAVDLSHGQTVAMALGFALANVAEPYVGATLLTRTVRHRTFDGRRALVAFLVGAVVVGPMVGGAIGATTAVMFGGASQLALVAGKWWLGDALGVLVVAAPILAWSRPSPFEAKARAFELSAIFVVAVGVTLVPAVLWQHPVLYAILPVLIWAAFRGGCRAVTLAGVGVAFAADWAVVTGRASDLMAPAPASQHLVLTQVFLALTLVAGITLAVEITERRRSEAAARSADIRRIEAERRAAEIADRERRRIARETHDIVGHGINVMLLQTGAARRVLDTDVDLARDLLASIEAVGRNACHDLDIALAVADTGAALSPGRGLARVPDLVDALRAGGMQIDLGVTGDTGRIPTLVDWSAYRIVQEALTNVAKHAPGAHARADIRVGTDAVVIDLVDDGVGVTPGDDRTGGRGLIGMRERVVALEGDLEVGPAASGGFRVHAELPLRPGRS